ncbi:MAG TPA: hypothetical protein VIM42_04210 [Clostridium sp.]
MEDIKLFDEDIEELKDIVIWAISEGYMTNEITKGLVYKLGIDKDTVKDLDKNCNVGIILAK